MARSEGNTLCIIVQLDIFLKIFSILVTEEMVRKRAEHNECEITTLEELSLHQQDIEKFVNVFISSFILVIVVLWMMIPPIELNTWIDGVET